MTRVDDEALLRALAGGLDTTAAAAATGCSTATAYSRQRDPLFRARLAELKGKELEGYAIQASRAVPDALATLHAITTGAFDAKSRTNAAAKLVDVALKLRNESYVYPRLAALEAALAQAGIDLPPAGVPKEPEPVVTPEPDSNGGEAD
jgi:hypothetical protein